MIVMFGPRSAFNALTRSPVVRARADRRYMARARTLRQTNPVTDRAPNYYGRGAAIIPIARNQPFRAAARQAVINAKRGKMTG